MEDKQTTQALAQRKVGGGMRTAKLYDSIFICLITILPMFMLAFGWIFINANSILLAFKQYDDFGNIEFAGMSNIVQVLQDYVKDPLTMLYFKNSVIVYLVTLIVTSIVPIVFSYYIFKKMWGSAFFKVVLFMPSIVSGICTVTIFKLLVDRVIPMLLGWDLGEGLLANPDMTFGTVVFYRLWLSFGGGMLTQIGAMNATDQSTIDAGQIDGVGFFGELWHIVLPKAYGIIFIGIYTGFPSLFTNDLGLYAFMGPGAPDRVSTIGYRYTVEMQQMAGSNAMTSYPYWAAWGLVCSIICIPMTFLLRYLVEHIGPSEE